MTFWGKMYTGQTTLGLEPFCSSQIVISENVIHFCHREIELRHRGANMGTMPTTDADYRMTHKFRDVSPRVCPVIDFTLHAFIVNWIWVYTVGNDGLKH